jgi:hypothetical protein
MSKKQLIKGKNFEYRIVGLAKKLGFEARRIPLSGEAQEKLDIEIDGEKFECKYRANGFRQIYDWLEKCLEEKGRGLIISAYRKEPLIVIPLPEYLKLKGGDKPPQ